MPCLYPAALITYHFYSFCSARKLQKAALLRDRASQNCWGIGAQKHFSTNNLAPLHCGRVTLRCVFCVFLQNFFERSYSSHPHDIYLLPFLVPSLLGTTSLPSITSLPYQSFQNLLNKPLSFESLSQPAQGGTQTNLQTFCLLSIRITKMLTE